VHLVYEFPYPELLHKLQRCNVVQLSDYYRLRPHKSIELMVKINNGENEHSGIYIKVKDGMLNDLQKKLSECKEVYNFHDVNEPWVFIDENSCSFKTNIDKLVEWINQQSKK
jgi:hypothetical protein